MQIRYSLLPFASSASCLESAPRDTLFAALLLTGASAFIAGNLLLLSAEVFEATALMMVPLIFLFCIFYSISSLFGGLAVGLCATLMSAILAVQLSDYGGIWILLVAGVVSALHTARTFRPQGVGVAELLLMAGVGTATSFSCFSVFTHFDNLHLAGRGMIHQDVAFHSALSAMIKNYGVVSTGLNGLVPTPDHALTHHLAAFVSQVSGQGTFEVWGVLLFVLFVPLVLFAVCSVAVALGLRNEGVPICWAFVCLCLVVPQKIAGAHFLTDWIYLSESYLLSVVILLLALPRMYQSRQGKYEAVSVVLISAIMAYTKASTVAIYAGLLCAQWMVIDRGRVGSRMICMLAAVFVAALFIFVVTDSDAGSDSWLTTEILQLVRMQDEQGVVDSAMRQLSGAETWSGAAVFKGVAAAMAFVGIHFIVSWLALAGGVQRYGFSILSSSPVFVSVWASLAGGLLCLLFFTSSQGANIYWFTGPAFFVALPVVAGAVASAALGGLGPIRTMFGLGVTILAIALVSYKSYYKHSRWAPFRSKEKLGSFIDDMRRLRESVPPHVILHADRQAWTIEPVYFGDKPGRWAAPLVFPAVSERAWINVIRPLPNGYPRAYGFTSYIPDGHNGEALSPPVIPPLMVTRDWKP